MRNQLLNNLRQLFSMPRVVYAMVADIRAMRVQLYQLEETMSAATDALNAAVDDLGKASQAILGRIEEESAKIDELLKGDDTPEVDAATARIKKMASELKDKLTALSTSAAAVKEDSMATNNPSSGAAAGMPVAGGPAHPLEGVPATPSGADVVGAGPAVPNTDHVVTETSPNADTSGPAAAPGEEPAAVASATPGGTADVGSSAGPADVGGTTTMDPPGPVEAEGPRTVEETRTSSTRRKG